jgi:peptidoglycan hydrolase CwlO-like protein
MKPKQRRSIGLIIRRIIAVFILLSTISGVVDAVVTNSFNDDVIGGVFVSLLIIYYLGRSPRKNNTNADPEIDNNNRDEIDIDFEMEELDEEFDESLEELESEQIQTNYNSPRVNKPNPVRDKQSFLSRLFQGRTDRY